MASAPDKAVIVEGLTKRFGSVAAVDGVSFEVAAGEVFGLIGADGAGKTTLLRMLCGVLLPDGGRASVAGADVARDPETVKRRIGYLSQAFSLYGDLSVEQNIRFCADLYHAPRRETARIEAEMLEMTDLARFRRRLAGRLSGGMKQKLGLVCALIHRPEVLILDEPTTGVDPISRRDFWGILASLPSQGVTVLLSSPYMDEASRCHRLALMHRGRILRGGTAEELQASVPGAVVEVVTDDPALASRALAGRRGVLSVTAFGDAIHVRLEAAGDPAAEVRAALEEVAVGVNSVGVVPASLEDAFLDAVGHAGEAPA